MLSFRLLFLFSFVILVSLSFINAQDLQISPTYINFIGSTGEKICNEVSVFPSSNLVFSNLWSLNDTKQLKDYVFLNEKLGIRVYYSGFEDNKTNICIASSRAGKFYGAFLFRDQNSSMGIGTWVSVLIGGENLINTEQNNIQNSAALRITGNVIGDNSPNNLFLILGLLPTLILALFLIYLLRKLR